MTEHAAWPDLPFAAWRDACETLHLWTQVVGKTRIALTPLVNHWWNATLLVTSRGLLAPAMRHRGDNGGGTFDVMFDFLDHRLVVHASDGGRESFALAPMTVADFHAAYMQRLARLAIDVRIWTMPVEIEDAVPFEQDHAHAAYDPDYAHRFWLALVRAQNVMAAFRARFLGKASPVHFFWGSFDLAVTRFSGRPAPPPKGTTPHLGGWVMAEAYSHECCSCGFWPGNGGYGRAAFYVYAYPEPAGYGDFKPATAGAFYDKELGQFILPYDVLQKARDPDTLLMDFLQETYAAAATLGGWDRAALERAGMAPRA